MASDSAGASGAGPTVIEAVDSYLSRKAVGSADAPGNYATNAAHVLHDWAEDHAPERLDDVTTADVRRYAGDHLRGRWRRDDIAASTAQTYFATVRAFLSWCVREGLIDTNPAAPDEAAEDLPTGSTEEADRQVWSAEARQDLLSWVRRRKESAYDPPLPAPRTRLQRTRDHAIVSLLANSGVRGAEVFRDRRDASRQGATWHDVDAEEGVLRVFGKSREYEEAPLPTAAAAALETYRAELDPGPEWPLFPTLHKPTLSRTVRGALEDDGMTARQANRAVDDLGYLGAAREHGVVPPSITTDGARSVMERLCDAAGVHVDGEYLKPHGGRRKLGDELYRRNPATAQTALRHTDISVTKESYSYIDAGEIGRTIDDLRRED